MHELYAPHYFRHATCRVLRLSTTCYPFEKPTKPGFFTHIQILQSREYRLGKSGGACQRLVEVVRRLRLSLLARILYLFRRYWRRRQALGRAYRIWFVIFALFISDLCGAFPLSFRFPRHHSRASHAVHLLDCSGKNDPSIGSAK